jgi:Tfp pilus assembly protein PilF
MFVSYRQVPTWKNNFTLYTHAVTMAPDSSLAHYRLGFAFASHNDCRTALPLYDRSLQLDPQNSRAGNNLGVCLMRLGNYEAAVPAFEQALKMRGGSQFRSWANLGVSQIQLGRRSEGCQSLGKAVAINPNYGYGKSQLQMFCSDAISPPP